MNYTLRQLEVFTAVARAENVSRAAEHLGMSQSATSTSLTEFERQFQIKLFDRVGKKLQLNELGHIILPRAIELLDRAHEIEALFEGKTGFGPMRIGATLTIGNYLATLLIGEFMQNHSGSHIDLDVHNTANIVKKVAEFELDFGLIEGDCSHPDLIAQSWVADELVIFAAPDHPLSHKTVVTLDDLVSTPWIARETGSGTRQTFEHGMRHVLSQLNIRLALEHTEAIKRAVESGMGIACISRLALKEAFRRGSLVEIPVAGLDFKRQFHFIWHKQKYLTPGMALFIERCKEVAAGVTSSDQIVLRQPII
ncbi:LysR family transcriptional regulator [Iodobacter ciconiae]|uniref:LysR family transcriptional regulator n=1 Tax=Iodobacter ciconiae TaxID=2496266 RepID=A0A3S8ZQ94_9NEIS|nr:LysR family transcriptional regulator [Iodobacter ciconiae]AZN35646.1 LysR family transcriptional regulator [Iodobacter ciconiae]